MDITIQVAGDQNSQDRSIVPLDILYPPNSPYTSFPSQSLQIFIDNAVKGARAVLSNVYVDTTEDLYSCSVCLGFMVDPVTLKCGHSIMKNCVHMNNWDCVKCGKEYQASYLSQLKTTVLIAAAMEKWWKTEMESAKICAKGNDFFQNGNSERAIEMYSRALKLDPDNHLAARGRSNVYLSIGQFLAALNDAESSLRLCSSPEGYLQKGTALVSLGRIDDAVNTYFECCIVFSKSKSAKVELKKLIQEVISKDHLLNLAQQKNRPGSVEQECLGLQRPRSGSGGSFTSTDSDDDSQFSPMDENFDYTNHTMHLQLIFDRVIHEVQQRKEIKLHRSKEIDLSLVDKSDFECPLCIRLVWQPISTPCGHTFCRTCLDRCFDHQPICPLCKTQLSSFLAERNQKVTTFIENTIKTLLPHDYAERKKIYEEELEEIANAGKDQEHIIPLFICTIGFPSVPCRLHVFEPRYRLMIRRCMEAGTQSFGMCAYIAGDTDGDGIATVGTVLEIRDVHYFPDGRSVVEAFGTKRFKVLNKGMKDGYHTGSVEFLKDEPPTGDELRKTISQHDNVRRLSKNWISHLPSDTKNIITDHFGPMPSVETDYLTDPNGPSWFWWMLAILPLDTKTQLHVLGMTSLYRRLDALQKILLHIQTSIFCDQ